MLGKIKKVLGIEGVKVELVLPDVQDKKDVVTGILRFSTKMDSEIELVRLQLIERYSRGRGSEKLIDEYVLGKEVMTAPFEIVASETLEVPFELPYIKQKSEMDKLQESNFLASGLVFLAKKAKRVSSTYKVRVDLVVKGTKLNPFDESVVII